MVTRSAAFGPTASVADIKTPIGTAYTFAKTGRIVSIRVNGYQGVTDKAKNGILILDFKKLSGPFEFAVMAANSEITVGGQSQTEEIEVDIPVDNGEVVTPNLTTAEALEECTISLKIVE